MSRRRLCVDIDNVLARTDEVMRRVIHQYTHGRVDLRYEDVVEFDYCKCSDATGARISKEDWHEIHDLFSQPEHLLSIEPFSDVQQHLTVLADVYQLHFVTTRLPKARQATIQWLENGRFPPHDMHFVQHGKKHDSLGTFSAAVEDHFEQAVAFAESGTPCYLIRHPWNQAKPHVEGLHWVSDWTELAEKLI